MTRSSAPEVEPSSRRILVMDDGPLVRRVVCHILAGAGYSVDSAANGLEGLEKIHASRPDLVILDIMMPEMDGWTVLERLGRAPGTPPVIVLSALADERRALRAGAVSVVGKPFQANVLLDACARALPRRP